MKRDLIIALYPMILTIISAIFLILSIISVATGRDKIYLSEVLICSIGSAILQKIDSLKNNSNEQPPRNP